MSLPGKSKKWAGIFPGTYSGNLWQTFNIDLEKKPGRIVLSDKMRIFASALGLVTKFIRSNALATDQWFGLISNNIIRNGNSVITAGTWIDDATSGSPTASLDAVIHESVNGEDRLFVTLPTDIAVLNTAATANTWDVDWGSTIPATPIPTTPALTYRPICKLQRLVAVANKVSGVPKIDTIDQNDVVQLGRIQFGAEYTVRLGMSNSNRFWFGLQHDFDGHAKIIEWDGTSLTYNKEYELVGSCPLTGFVVKDIPYYIDEKGLVYRFNGSGFVVVQDFNLQEDRNATFTFSGTNATILPNGNYVDGDIVYLNVAAMIPDATAINITNRRARSGIWIYNTKTGNLYHHMGLGEHASAGTDINYGTSALSSPGTVLKAKVGNDKILIASAVVYTGGATWRTNTTQGLYRMISNTDQASNAGRNRGYFITPYIPIAEVEAMWEALWVKFKRFVNSGNRIVVKWRVLDPLYNASATDPSANPLELMTATGTWVNTTSFTCAVPLGVAVGDEVEILSGDNAGCNFNVSALSATPDNTTVITVTITETAPTSSTDTFLCRFDNFKTETAISSVSVGSQKVPFTSIGHGEFIQLKIEMQGFGVEIDELIPALKVKTKANQT